MLHRTRIKVDAIRAIIRDCRKEERDHILAIIADDKPAPTVIDRDVVERALADAGGHIGRAADLLCVARRTLQKKMREYNIPTGIPGRRSRFV